MKLCTFFWVGSLVACSLVACDKNDASDTNATNAQDRTFVMNASMSNRAEIELGNLAASRATNQAVKAFGQHMVTEHTQAQTDLQAAINGTDASMHLNDSLPAGMIATRTMLMGLSGRSFDSAFSKTMVTSHTQAITLFQTEANAGMNATIRNYASSKLPNLQEHLQAATTLAAQF